MRSRTCPECGLDELSYERTCADHDEETIYEYVVCYYCGYEEEL
jgi:hypothetical protein